MMALKVIGVIIAYFLIGAVVAGIANRAWNRLMGEHERLDLNTFELGLLSAAWPLILVASVLAGLSLMAGSIASAISGIGARA